MPDQYIEKSLLYLVVLSILIHAAVFAIIYFSPDEKHDVKPEPYMVELQDLPELQTTEPEKKSETKRKSDIRSRVAREIAPRGEMPKEKKAAIRGETPPGKRLKPSATVQKGREPDLSRETGREMAINRPRGGDLLVERREKLPELARLYPGAGKLASLEENYRKKYGPEVQDGETRFLNTDDILFGSFLRRFETAVYGVWTYPPDAVRLGIEGVTPVKITFNRQGEVEDVQLLESSGSKILDDEVFRTLRKLGPIGSFPKGYDKEKFNLIAFFQYGIIRGISRGAIH